jgi:hypothetical protein
LAAAVDDDFALKRADIIEEVNRAGRAAVSLPKPRYYRA